jgi:multiple sugar transport system permease protein
MAVQRTARARRQGAGLDRFLPYLLLAPAVLLVLAVVVYPLGSGVETSMHFYRFGSAVSNVGFSQYRQALDDSEFTGAAWTTLKFVVAAVGIETALGLGLALLCVRELPFIRAMRVVLIVPKGKVDKHDLEVLRGRLYSGDKVAPQPRPLIGRQPA